MQRTTAALPTLRQPVLDWLAAHGVNAADINDYGDALRVRTDAGTVSRLFNTTLRHFRYSGSRRSPTSASSPLAIARAADGQISIPPSLAASLHLLKGVARLPATHSSHPCNTRTTPHCSSRSQHRSCLPSLHFFASLSSLPSSYGRDRRRADEPSVFRRL